MVGRRTSSTATGQRHFEQQLLLEHVLFLLAAQSGGDAVKAMREIFPLEEVEIMAAASHRRYDCGNFVGNMVQQRAKY